MKNAPLQLKLREISVTNNSFLNFGLLSPDPEPDLHYSTEDHTQHEEKKNCEQRSRNFPPRWNKSVAVIQCKGKIYCGTCVNFFFSLFCWTSGLSLWAGDFLDLLAHCLVSKKVSVEH